MIDKASDDIKLKELLRIMDVASALRQQREEVQQQLNIDETRADLRDRILAATKVTGEQLTTDEINAAIDSYFSGLYSFKEPPRNFQYRLANMYINRGKIFRRIAVPIVTLGVVAGLAWGAVTGFNSCRAYLNETSAETAVEQRCERISGLSTDIDSLSSQSLEGKIQDGLTGAVSDSRALLSGTDDFYDSFCGNVSKIVTSGNYRDAENQAKSIDGILDAVRVGIDEGRGFIQLDTSYKSIRAVAKEDAAIAQADSVYDEVVSYIDGIAPNRVLEDAAKLSNLEAVLQQDYKVTIVSKEGVKSGIDRYFGGSISGYYVIVEARDAQGNVLKMSIRNEENGETETVKLWGERVPQSVYERVKADKMDDGIVNDNQFGVKDKGYLDMSVVMRGDNNAPLQREGQITEW